MHDERQELADRRVEAARAGLACSVDALERRVVGAVDTATASVRDTAVTIRSVISDAKDGAQDLYQRSADGVRQLLDVPHHIRAHPWPSVGIAAVAGFVVGSFASMPKFRSFSVSNGSGHTLFGDLSAAFKRELLGVGESAILAASHALKDNIRAASASFASQGMHEHNGFRREMG